uniref:Uncharacterized protein n=1 Tax=Globisporangium ultimum (strain ATCC 200006 / CBS 805.95 / DAOM BR144) TaxID=431595 RepID=K3WZF4_GLOUD
MTEGVPTHWRRKFESILNDKTPARNRKRKQDDEESEYSNGPEDDDEDAVTKPVKRESLHACQKYQLLPEYRLQRRRPPSESKY